MEFSETGNGSVKLKAEASLAGQAQLRGDREPGVSQMTFPLQGRFFRSVTFSAVTWPVPSEILILSTSVFHKTSSINDKINLKPQTKGTCLALCYFTL